MPTFLEETKLLLLKDSSIKRLFLPPRQYLALLEEYGARLKQQGKEVPVDLELLASGRVNFIFMKRVILVGPENFHSA